MGVDAATWYSAYNDSSKSIDTNFHKYAELAVMATTEQMPFASSQLKCICFFHLLVVSSARKIQNHVNTCRVVFNGIMMRFFYEEKIVW